MAPHGGVNSRLLFHVISIVPLEASYLLAVVMDDFDTLLSGSTLCLAYAKFPVFYLFLSCLHISQCRSISLKGAVCPAVSRSDPG